MGQLKFNGKEIITGSGTLSFVEQLKGERFFITTGFSAMFKNGTIGKIEAMMEKNNKAYEIYSGIGANPTTEEVEKGRSAMAKFNPDVVIAVGGGSAIDATKVMCLLCDDETITLEAIRSGKAPQERKNITLVAIPSTSGTAAEVTRAAVITYEKEQIKIGLKNYAFIPDYAILDGDLTLSMPKHVVVETGMDALTHALESLINKNANNFTMPISYGAAEGILKWLPESVEKGDINSRQQVHDFQALAGMAFQNAGLGMSHGIAHSFGGVFGTAHGLLNAVALPVVLRYNAQDPVVKERLDVLSNRIGEDVIEKIEAMNKAFGVPKTFLEMGIKEEDYIKDYDLLLANSLLGSTLKNPIKMDAEKMAVVLKTLVYGE